jgi:hypothetical protein
VVFSISRPYDNSAGSYSRVLSQPGCLFSCIRTYGLSGESRLGVVDAIGPISTGDATGAVDTIGL